jgi:hypothetical protein
MIYLYLIFHIGLAILVLKWAKEECESDMIYAFSHKLPLRYEELSDIEKVKAFDRFCSYEDTSHITVLKIFIILFPFFLFWFFPDKYIPQAWRDHKAERNCKRTEKLAQKLEKIIG